MIENKAGLRIVRPGERLPGANVVPFRSRVVRDTQRILEPDMRRGWMVRLQNLDPQEADVAWRILDRHTDDDIGAALGISVDEVQDITKRARSKILEQIGS